MKKIYFLFSILFFKGIISQEVLTDNWLGIQTFSSTSIMNDYNVSTIVDNKIIMVIDTFNSGMSNRSGLFTYDINTRNIGNINFSLAGGDRGIKCATSYKTGTPGLEYGIFGCYALADAGESFPVVYTYNSQTGTVAADSLQEGNTSIYDGGIQKIIMYSPSTNNDTMRVFSRYNFGLSVFSKHINQSTFSPLSSVPISIDNVNTCYIFNNILYIGGMYLDQPCLLESTDGRTFTPVAGFNPGSFPLYSCINNITSYNNQLYYSVNIPSNNDFNLFKYSAPSHILVQSSGSGYEEVKSMTVFKNKLWVSTAESAMSMLSNIYVLDSPGNVDTSAVQFGYQDVDGNYLELITNNDSLYFVGNKGTFQASKSVISGSANVMQLLNKYINIAKLNTPISSFIYNNNLICLNSTESFTSTSQFTDSLHWIVDGIYYASSPGSSAYMNVNFPSVGTHTVGLVAYGGNLADTSFLSVNVYSISLSITGPSNLCQGDSLHLVSSIANGIGAINYNWFNTGIAFGTNSPNINSLPSTGSYNYYVIASDIHGCSAISNTVNTTVSSLKNMSGTITSASVGIAGNLTLYRYEPILTKFDSITTISIGGAGSYNFTNLIAGDYILKAIPSSSTLQTTYYGTNAISWKDATPITHGCISNSNIDIEVDSLRNIGSGPGKLTGLIYQGNGFGHRISSEAKPLIPGTPIGGIIVKGGKNPGGQMFVQTVTAADGTYTLSGIPINTGDTYFILVDIPGLDTNGTYRRVLTSGTPEFNGLDFMVDSIQVNPLGFTTSISQDNSVLENKIRLYPNPAKEFSFIEYELIESANIQIELFDILGKKSKTILAESKQEKNKYKHSINLTDLNSGIYFVKVKINNSENVIKLIITN